MYINRVGKALHRPYSGVANAIWRLDGNANDSSGNGNDGSASSVSYVSGTFGQAASFNGSSSRISVASNGYTRPSRFSILAWIKTTQSGNGTIFQNWRYANSVYYGYIFGVSGGALRCLVASATGQTPHVDFASCSGLIDIDVNAWLHVAVTFDESNIRLYVGGEPDEFVTWSSVGYYATQYPHLGARYDESAYAEYYSGYLDDVVLLDNALPASQIRALAR